VSQKHNVDECCEFPEKIVAYGEKDGCGGVEESYGDGGADEGHHAGLMAAEFLG
jgi:hypothetical protein